MLNQSEVITSRSNAWIKLIQKIASRGITSKNGAVIAESPHLLSESLRSSIEIERVFVNQRMESKVAGNLPTHQQIPLHVIADKLFDEIATTTRNQGVLALIKLPDWEPENVFTGMTLALDGVQDPGNAGMIIRSAEAFGASGIVLLKGSVAPSNPKLLRASAGSLFRLPFLHGVEHERFLELTSSHRKNLFASVQTGALPVHKALLDTDSAVIIGSETHGISPRLQESSTLLAIPTRTVESLNAAAAATTILYEFYRRQLLP